MSIFSRTEEVLYERGWGKGELVEDESGAVCLLGALGVAFGVPMVGDKQVEEAYCFLDEQPEVKFLEELIMEIYSPQFSIYDEGPTCTVFRYNDDEEVVLEDIISLVRKADQRMGDIGNPVKTVEFEPMPQTVPAVEPAAPAVAPVEEPVPA